MPWHIKSLPVELLILVLEAVWEQQEVFSDREMTDFSDLALVCSAWRPLVQRILYSEVSLKDHWHAKDFPTVIIANPSLGRAVTSLDFWGMYKDVEPETCVHLIRSITDLCPQLYKLRIDLWKRTPQDAFLDVIGPHTFANLKALAISIKHERGWFHQYSLAEDERPRFFELTYKDVIKFLSRFSSLRHLYIPEGLSCKRAGFPSLPPPPSFRLYELACSGEDFNRAPRESILDWCLAENPDTLKIFSIDNLKHTLSWVSFLRRHGKNIRSLQICRHDDLMHVENNLREFCPYLQELILPMSRFPPLLRERIPTENLEHLLMLSDSSSEKFDSVSRLRAREQEVTEVVDWILSLPRIRQITLCTHDGLYGNLLFPHIWERCTSQGIELRLQHRRRYINLGIHTEMIPACHFPREEGTAFNMSIMKRLANSEATHPAWSA